MNQMADCGTTVRCRGKSRCLRHHGCLWVPVSLRNLKCPPTSDRCLVALRTFAVSGRRHSMLRHRGKWNDPRRSACCRSRTAALQYRRRGDEKEIRKSPDTGRRNASDSFQSAPSMASLTTRPTRRGNDSMDSSPRQTIAAIGNGSRVWLVV